MHPLRAVILFLILAAFPVFVRARRDTLDQTTTRLSPITASPQHTGDIRVHVDHRVVLHPNDSSLEKACHAPYRVKACTVFPVERLECRCEQKGSAWFISIEAEIDAVIQVGNEVTRAPHILHEQRHVADIEAGLIARLQEFAAHPFETREACDHRALFLATSAHVRALMNELRAASNEKSGCSRLTRRAAGH